MITLTTDFGLKDPWVGSMKGVILSINPEARVVDITHLVSAHNMVEAAFIIASSVRFFPQGTVHLAVVDPGVGGRRRPIVVETEDYLFVGPDNGIFTEALKREKVKRAIHITGREYMLPSVSHTFHGRDIFAPVAAHLSGGVEPQRLGPVLDTLERLTLPAPSVAGDIVEGEVIYVDSFGNLVTNIDDALLRRPASHNLKVEIRGVTIEGLAESYEEGSDGGPVAILGSTGYLEIAFYRERADATLGACPGERVAVKWGA